MDTNVRKNEHLVSFFDQIFATQKSKDASIMQFLELISSDENKAIIS